MSSFNYMLPAVLAAVGAVLLVGGAVGMSDRRRPIPLRRDPSHGYIGGVCAGFAARLGIDPLLIRIGFVADPAGRRRRASRSTSSAGR